MVERCQGQEKEEKEKKEKEEEEEEDEEEEVDRLRGGFPQEEKSGLGGARELQRERPQVLTGPGRGFRGGEATIEF